MCFSRSSLLEKVSTTVGLLELQFKVVLRGRIRTAFTSLAPHDLANQISIQRIEGF